MTNFATIPHCRMDPRSSEFIPLFKMEPIPMAGSFAATYEEAKNAPLIPFTLVVNKDSGLMQCLEDVNPDLIYKKYQYNSSEISALIKHFSGLTTKFLNRYGVDNEVKLLEIGCNSFPLLNQLPYKWKLVGVDPSDVAKNAEKNPNIYLYNTYFTAEFVKDHGLINALDVVTASNCLAHFFNLSDAFLAAGMALRPGGEFWVEVKDGESLMNAGAWDDLYAEHPALHTIHSLKKSLGEIGFEYIEHEILPFHGGLIRACFRKPISFNPVFFNYPLPENYFENLVSKWAEIQKNYDNRFDSPVAKQLMGTSDNVAWGASGKASVLLSSLRPKIRFSYIVDDAPSKQGKFLPHTGIPIVGKHVLESEMEDKNVLVTSWNYYDTIVNKNKNIEGVNWLRYF